MTNYQKSVFHALNKSQKIDDFFFFFKVVMHFLFLSRIWQTTTVTLVLDN